MNAIWTKCVCETQMPPIMANTKDGLGHKEKYFDTSTKNLSKEMIMCNIKTLILSFRSNDQHHFFNWSKVKCQQTDLITRKFMWNIKAQALTIDIVINMIKVLKKYAKLQCQGHRVNNVGFHEKVLSPTKTIMWSIKSHCLTVISKVNFSLK